MNVTAKLTVTIGSADFFVEADCTAFPGEKMVRYYSDGSGHPGTDPTIECDNCTVLEVQWGYYGSYDYLDRDDLGGHAKLFDRIVLSHLRDGTHDDELFANIDDYEDSGYDD